MTWGKPRRAGARPLSGPMTWCRKKSEDRKPYPPLEKPEPLSTPRGPLRWFDDERRLAEAKKWGAGYGWVRS